MTEDYRNALETCVNILNHAEKHGDNQITDLYPDIEKSDIVKMIVNPYSLQIPKWLLACIDVCCGINKQFAMVMFIELTTSIRFRKFNGDLIQHDYVITPKDWAECYEDGYPICTNDCGGCFEFYLKSYLEYSKQFKTIVNCFS